MAEREPPPASKRFLPTKAIKLTDLGRQILGVDRPARPRDATPIKGAVVPLTKVQRERAAKRRAIATASRRRNRRKRKCKGRGKRQRRR